MEPESILGSQCVKPESILGARVYTWDWSGYFVILFSSFTFLSSIFTTWSRINSLSDGCQQRWQSTLFISDKIYKSVYPSFQVPVYVQALFLSISLSLLISGVSYLSLSCVSALCLLSLSSAVSQLCLRCVSAMSKLCVCYLCSLPSFSHSLFHS